MSTASTILSLAFNQLKAEQDGTDVPGMSTVDMLSVLNTVNQEWQRAFRRGSGEPLPAIRKETAYDLITPTALASDSAAGATSITLDDSSDLASSGAFVIYDDNLTDIAEYTSNAANVLSGVTGLAFAHEDGDQLYPLYALPSDFESFRGDEESPSGVRMDGGTPLEYTSSPPTGFRFSLYDNGTTKYLWLPPGLTGTVSVLYNKDSTTIDDANDSIDIPPAYDWFAVWRLVAHGKRSRGDIVQKIQYANGHLVDEDDHRADQILLEAQKERNIGKGPKVRPLGFVRNFGIYRTNLRET